MSPIQTHKTNSITHTHTHTRIDKDQRPITQMETIWSFVLNTNIRQQYVYIKNNNTCYYMTAVKLVFRNQCNLALLATEQKQRTDIVLYGYESYLRS